MNVARIARKEKREKAKKQEIRRVHNSNPLQRHEHVQPSSLLLIMILKSKYNDSG